MDPPLDELATSGVTLAEVLALARALHQLAGKHGGTTFPDTTAMAAMLQTLGASRLDPAAFTAWWDAVIPKPVVRRPRFGRRREVEVAPPCRRCSQWHTLPDGGRPDRSADPGAGVVVRGRHARPRRRAARRLPVWVAYPAMGHLRSDDADRWGVPVAWPLAFVHLMAERARMGLRELDWLGAAAEQGKALAAELRIARQRLHC